ncbi:MAG: hypothetical protein C5B51_11090 [Terriglobia bacterium]|nr:MAG: hypothetical protein C5B51_11090 [Terriglobia bacterium]
MGQIITFYSYKGGTGRSMALANLAWMLAANDQRVLVMDWDLEAPGLHRYFRPFLVDKELTGYDSRGLIDFVFEFAKASATPPSSDQRLRDDWYRAHANVALWKMPLSWPNGEELLLGPQQKGTIHFVPAGRQDEGYGARVNAFHWNEFYERGSGGAFLGAVRQSLRAYDYVLIDSRTGVSDTSGICTVQMPDIVVLCFTLNHQGITGAAGVAKSIREQRKDIRIYPIPMRVEDSETDMLNRMRTYARSQFTRYLEGIDVERYWFNIEIPYIKRYAYYEQLAPFEEQKGRTGSMLPPMQQLGYYVTAGRFQTMPQPPAEHLESVRAEYQWLPGMPVEQVAEPMPVGAAVISKPLLAVWALVFVLLAAGLVVVWPKAARTRMISVAVDPPSLTLAAGQAQQFVASVRGIRDHGVTWSANLGSISPAGLYQAPPAETEVTATITATSTVDRSQSASALVRVTKDTSVAITPTLATLKPNQQQVFRLPGDILSSVADWRLEPALGTLDFEVRERRRLGDAIRYTAPPNTTQPVRVILTASKAGSYSASVGIQLLPESGDPEKAWGYFEWPSLILGALMGAFGAYIRGWTAIGIYTQRRWALSYSVQMITGTLAGFVTCVAYQSLGTAVDRGTPFSIATVGLLAGFLAPQALELVSSKIFTPVYNPTRFDRLN